MPEIKDEAPIVVEVQADRWDAYGPITSRSTYLYQVLSELGGINESVPPGQYHFNVIIEDGQLIADLHPIE